MWRDIHYVLAYRLVLIPWKDVLKPVASAQARGPLSGQERTRNFLLLAMCSTNSCSIVPHEGLKSILRCTCGGPGSWGFHHLKCSISYSDHCRIRGDALVIPEQFVTLFIGKPFSILWRSLEITPSMKPGRTFLFLLFTLTMKFYF